MEKASKKWPAAQRELAKGIVKTYADSRQKLGKMPFFCKTLDIILQIRYNNYVNKGVYEAWRAPLFL